METALTIGFWILMVILGIMSIIAMIAAYATRCLWVICTSLPVATWVSFDEVLKLGFGTIVTACVLDILYDMGTVSTRFVGDEEVLEEMELLRIDDEFETRDEDGEPTYDVGYPEYFEYMLHRRPRRKRRLQDWFRKRRGSSVPVTA